MSLLLATAGENTLVDTFEMSRRQTLWPVLNTAESGTWAWFSSSSSIFGGYYQNTSSGGTDYLEFDNIPLQPGTYKISAIGVRFSDRGEIYVYHDNTDTGARLNFNGSIEYNHVASDTFTVSAKARGPIKLAIEGGTNFVGIQQIEIVKTSADSDVGASLDDLPWTSDAPVYSYSASSSAPSLTVNTTYTWGGYVQTPNTINEYIEYKVWLVQGTYDFDVVAFLGVNRAIATVSINGSSVGSVDMYSGTGVPNSIQTISSISVATTGVHTIRLTAATKNASSSGYFMLIQWLQFRKTAETGAITPTGTTYARETLELWPWFADTTVNFVDFVIQSSQLYYGYLINNATKAVNDNFEHAHNIKPGTYDLEIIGQESSGRGIVHISEGAGDLATLDWYNASLTSNVNKTASVPLAGGTITFSMDSKNASSAAYALAVNQIRLVRTGA